MNTILKISIVVVTTTLFSHYTNAQKKQQIYGKTVYNAYYSRTDINILTVNDSEWKKSFESQSLRCSP